LISLFDASFHPVDPVCTLIRPVELDIDTYLGEWFVVAQAINSYQPEEFLNCVQATYTTLPPADQWSQIIKEFLGWNYNIDVFNQAKNAQGYPTQVNLCGLNSDPDLGALKVAPCFLPNKLGGDYWVVYYEEGEVAVVTVGQPNFNTRGSLCIPRGKTGDNGLWILAREKECTNPLNACYSKYLDALNFIADNNIDEQVLEIVDWSSCDECFDSVEYPCADITRDPDNPIPCDNEDERNCPVSCNTCDGSSNVGGFFGGKSPLQGFVSDVTDLSDILKNKFKEII